MSVRQGPKLEVVVPLDADLAGLVTTLMTTATEAGESTDSLRFDGRRKPLERIRKEVVRRRSFVLESDTYEASFSCFSAYEFGYLTVVGAPFAHLIRCAERVAGVSPIVSVRWYDATYDYWQNAEDPLLYSAAGRSTDGLPKRPNELPPPLDQVVVDTTRNPGRMILRDGYVEAIGHKMWFGPEFFRRVPGSSHRALHEAPMISVVDVPGGLVEVIASDEPFRDETSASIQDALRRLLFPTTFDKRSTKQGHDVGVVTAVN